MEVKKVRYLQSRLNNTWLQHFGIDGSRITTNGRTKPLIPSEQPGGSKELALPDKIGDALYNTSLSQSRSEQTQKVVERVLAGLGINDVKFETSGFGEDPDRSPFDNNLPEERFYNRTVVIDIVPAI